MLRFPVVAALALLFAGTTSAQQSEPDIVPEKLSDNFYVLYGGNGQGSNVGMSIGEDGILLVDAMKAETGEKLLKVIRTISQKPIKFVISTHSDFDHAGANAFFSKMGATTIGQNNFNYSDAVADLKVGEFTLNFNGEEIVAQAVVSHSFDDLIIYFPMSDVIFMGDTFTNRYHPTFYAGGIDGQMEAIDTALNLGDEGTRIVPGHGRADTKSGLRDFKQNTSAWFARVMKLNELNMSIKDMANDEDLIATNYEFLKFRSPREIPEKAFHRFIQRTLSVGQVRTYVPGPDQIQVYTGSYQRDDGRLFEIIFKNNKFIGREYGVGIYELMPLSATEFHPRGSLSTRFVFALNDDGQVDTLIIASGDSEIIATPIRD